MLIDTHGHVNFNAFREDADEVLQRALADDTWVIMPGSQYSTSKKAVEIAGNYEKGVYAAIGLHPVHTGEKREVDVMETQGGTSFTTKEEKFDLKSYRSLLYASKDGQRFFQNRKVVAIGEVGLDYYRLPKNKEAREKEKITQKNVLREQIELALEFDLPIILHCRAAHENLLEVLEAPTAKLQTAKLRGVLHSYTGSAEQAQKFLEMGLYIGFNGLIFKEVLALPEPAEVISSIPLERILLETDSPYLTPPQAIVGTDPTMRNEPLFVKYVAEEIARIKGISVEEVASATTANAKALFRLI